MLVAKTLTADMLRSDLFQRAPKYTFHRIQCIETQQTSRAQMNSFLRDGYTLTQVITIHSVILSFSENSCLESGKSEKPSPGFIHKSNAFIPFSFGPANCVGRALARREMTMVAVALLRKFDLAFAPGYLLEGNEMGPDDGQRLKRWERDLCDYFVSTKGPLKVVLRERMWLV
jgi:hypothetical protein